MHILFVNLLQEHLSINALVNSLGHVLHELIAPIISLGTCFDRTFERPVLLMPSQMVIPVADGCEPHIFADHALVRLYTGMLASVHLHVRWLEGGVIAF